LICLIFSQTGVSAKTIKYTTVNKSNAEKEEAQCWYILNKLVRGHKKMYLVTKHLVIRNFKSEDLPQAFAYLSDPNVMYFIENPYSIKDTEEFINNNIKNPRVYAVAEKTTNKVIGHVIFHPYEYDEIYEIGWIISKAYQGQGFAYELSKALFKYGFDKLKLHKILAVTVEGNKASLHLMEKLNMTREGILRKQNWDHGKWIDEYWYSILAEEYKEYNS
jgi:RimJ/RimL family protein N-acetyltransferase